MVIYYTNTWNVSSSSWRNSLHPFRVLQSLAFPMLSTSIFSSNGSIYQQSAVFDSQFQLNQTALDIIGLPALTGSNAWASLTSNLAVSLLVRNGLDLSFLLLIRLVAWSHTLSCSGVHTPAIASNKHIETNNQILTIKWVWLYSEDNPTLQLDTGDAKIQRKSLVVVCYLTLFGIYCWWPFNFFNPEFCWNSF